jgi:glycine oxidase
VHSDVVIVGAGIIGLTTALELSRHGASVTILERGLVGRESSWAGAGILSPLLPWDESHPIIDLSLFSARLYAEWVKELIAETGMDPEYTRCGLLLITDEQREPIQTWCNARGIRSNAVDSASVFPKLRNTPALWFPDVDQIRSPRLLVAVRRQLQHRGVTIRENSDVTGLQVVADRVVSLHTSAGKVSAASVVICTGAWGNQLLNGLALGVDIQPVRGQILLFKSSPDFLPCILFEDHIYCVPRKDGHILVGTTLEHVGFDNNVTQQARRDLLDAAAKLLPGMNENHLVNHWAGLRPRSSSNTPVIDRHPSVLNLYANIGHFRYGVTMAPGSAQILARTLLKLPQEIDPTPYRWNGLL